MTDEEIMEAICLLPIELGWEIIDASISSGNYWSGLNLPHHHVMAAQTAAVQLSLISVGGLSLLGRSGQR